MDITLERILSLIPKKPDGKFVHGAKKAFADSIGAPANIMNEWERGANKSYRNYIYQIAAKYNVSVEWLQGETDSPAQKEKPAPTEGDELKAHLANMSRAQLLALLQAATQRLQELEE